MTRNQVLASHWGGNQNVRAVLDALGRHEVLGVYATTVALADPPPWWLGALPNTLRSELLRRQYELSTAKLRRRGGPELRRLLASRVMRRVSGAIDPVQADLDQWVARSLGPWRDELNLAATYAFEDCALRTFEAASRLGLTRVYDLPIAYWETGRGLLLEEVERRPDWASTLGGGLDDPPEKLDRKVRELELADLVVTPSQFVTDSLPEWAAMKPRVVAPFGTPTSGHVRGADVDGSKPLRVLFAGSMSQRKGLADLLDAVTMLGRGALELVVMGTPESDMAFYRRFADFTHESGRPHDQVLALMRTCDVLCLPSLYEGRALVMQEAMSQGLPIVVTANTGGADLVIEGETGYLVPIRAPRVIAERLAWFADHREETRAMGIRAAEHAATYSWAAYGDQIVASLQALLD